MSQLLQYYKSFQQARNPAPTIAPTFEDLSIDDNLTELQRLVRYVKSSIGLQRLVHVKMLADVSSSVGFAETNSQIIPLLEGLSFDTERAVKQHLTEQLSLLAKLCCSQGEDEGYRAVVDQILPITARLLEDDEAEVRQAACHTIVDVAKLVRTDDLGQHVLTIILRLAHEDDKEEMRMTACELLNSMAECLGHDLCKQFVIPEVVSLAEDPVFRVRKATALNFHNICKVGGEHELFERLMPAFVRLSKDDMFRVRRACAESLSEISKHVSDDIRVGVLQEIYLRLTQDPSKLVKQSTLQQSGMFISTLPPRAVNEFILMHFCSMASGPTGDMSVDAELKHYCAYSFPAVLQTVGAERWGELRDLYRSLVQSPSIQVKQTLAASLHEIARILGDCNLVKEELVPIFEDLIQDVEVVQMGVIKHLADFLKMLPEPCRVSYLPQLHDILHQTNPFNWRLRQSLAIQLPDLLCLPPLESIYNTLFPLVMTLLQDPVASVRRDSFKGVAKMISMLSGLADNEIENSNSNSNSNNKGEDNSNTPGQQQLYAVIQAINTFIRVEAFQLRQLWVELSHRLLRDLPKQLFEKFFIDGILILTCDPVSNVRAALGIMLGGWATEDCAPWEDESKLNVAGSSNSSDIIVRISPWKWLMERADIRECVTRLSRDDNDVYLAVVKLQPIFPDVIFESISCRGRKEAPGGKTPVVKRIVDSIDSDPNIEVDHIETISTVVTKAEESEAILEEENQANVSTPLSVAETNATAIVNNVQITEEKTESPSTPKLKSTIVTPVLESSIPVPPSPLASTIETLLTPPPSPILEPISLSSLSSTSSSSTTMSSSSSILLAAAATFEVGDYNSDEIDNNSTNNNNSNNDINSHSNRNEINIDNDIIHTADIDQTSNLTSISSS